MLAVLKGRGTKTIGLHLGLAGHRSFASSCLTSVFIDSSCDYGNYYMWVEVDITY